MGQEDFAQLRYRTMRLGDLNELSFHYKDRQTFFVKLMCANAVVELVLMVGSILGFWSAITLMLAIGSFVVMILLLTLIIAYGRKQRPIQREFARRQQEDRRRR